MLLKNKKRQWFSKTLHIEMYIFKIPKGLLKEYIEKIHG